MLFSSSVFLFAFLPVLLVLYYNPFFKSRKFRNVILLLVSLFFYAWGEPVAVLVLLFTIVTSWAFGLLICRNSHSNVRKKVFAASALILSIGTLVIFKYLAFFIDNINAILNVSIVSPQIALPIGVSFYTFQAVSYIVDVARDKEKAQSSILNVGLYLSLFPQLIAGPIVRYETIAAELTDRRETIKDFSDGTVRFIIGLAKKVLIADVIARVADSCFSAGELSVVSAWLGAIAYTLQIYFDFSGYSDMAIGLGRMFGFHFLENFNYPYISASITEFWRRWHKSLSTWFRDYVYIPLGGNRTESKTRNFFNLFVVWLLTGLWHGANWTFVLWGGVYFVLIIIERQFGLETKKTWWSRLYTMAAVVIAWVVFRAESVQMAIEYIGRMFGVNAISLADPVSVDILRSYWSIFIIAAVASTPIFNLVSAKQRELKGAKVAFVLCMTIIIVLAVASIINGSYSPFIYFNF